MKQVLKRRQRAASPRAPRRRAAQLYAATAPGVEGGEFYGPDGFREARGNPTAVEPTSPRKRPRAGRRLWEVSEELTGVSYKI